MSTSGIDVIKLCSSKFELHKAFEKIVKVSSSGSVSYIEQLICRTVDYTSVLVSVTDYKFTLIPCLHSFDFFDPFNVSYYQEQDVSFIFKFKCVVILKNYCCPKHQQCMPNSVSGSYFKRTRYI